MSRLQVSIAAALGLALPGAALAGAFIFASGSNPNVITSHAVHWNGRRYHRARLHRAGQ